MPIHLHRLFNIIQRALHGVIVDHFRIIHLFDDIDISNRIVYFLIDQMQFFILRTAF